MNTLINIKCSVRVQGQYVHAIATFITPLYCCCRVIWQMSLQFILHLWGRREAFFDSTNSIWVFTIPCTLGPTLFVGFSLPLVFFIKFIISIWWVVHVNFIKLPLHHTIGSPLPIFGVSGNILLWFIDTPGLYIVRSLNITLVRVPYFSVGAFLGYISPSSLEFLMHRCFYLNSTDKVLEKEI